MCLSAIFRNFEGNWPGPASVREGVGDSSAGRQQTARWAPQEFCAFSAGSVKEKTSSRRSVFRSVCSQFPVALLNRDLNSQSPSIGNR